VLPKFGGPELQVCDLQRAVFSDPWNCCRGSGCQSAKKGS